MSYNFKSKRCILIKSIVLKSSETWIANEILEIWSIESGRKNVKTFLEYSSNHFLWPITFEVIAVSWWSWLWFKAYKRLFHVSKIRSYSTNSPVIAKWNKLQIFWKCLVFVSNHILWPITLKIIGTSSSVNLFC